MYIDTAKSKRGGKTYTRYLLRDSYREDGKVKHRTIANLGQCSDAEIQAIKLALKHKNNLSSLGAIDQVVIKQGKRFGAVWCLNKLASRLGLTKVLGSDRQGLIALWQVIARIIQQGSRLSALRMTESHAVEEVLGISGLKKDELYKNLTWLAENQDVIEKNLWEMRSSKMKDDFPRLFLYDVTSSYLEGNSNELAAYGYNRDGKKSKKQVVIGLLTDEDGRPVAVRVFEGNTSDPKTVSEQIKILAQSFGITEVTFVGDRGMLKHPQLDSLPEGFSYITAITKPSMQKLLDGGIIQLGLFDSDLHEVLYEGVRYIYRRNPIRQSEIQTCRKEKYTSAEKLAVHLNKRLSEHPKSKTVTALKKLQEKIANLEIDSWVEIAVDEVNRVISINKKEGALAQEALLDGVYVIKTDVPEDKATAQIIHDRYKSLANVERAFRTMKTAHLELRPIYVRKDPRTRGHVFVVMLACMIVQELEKYWNGSGMTVQEGVDELTAISLAQVAIEEATCWKLPQPNDRASKLLQLASLVLPDVLPMPKKKTVHTKKNKQ